MSLVNFLASEMTKKSSLRGSSVGLGSCLTKDGGFRVRASRGDTGEYSYSVSSPRPLGDYGDA